MSRPDPRSAAAALLSFLFPGLGQAYNRQWALAWLLAVPVLLIVVLAALAFALGGRGTLSRLFDSRVLVALIVLDLALLGWRLVAMLQAHAERSRLDFRAWPTWVTGGLLVVTVGMHAVPAWYASRAMGTIGAIALEGGGRALDWRQGTNIDVPEPSEQPEVQRGERVTVLLVGVDFTAGRSHQLTDTMLVATLDPRTGSAAMISVPRDLYGVPLGDGRTYTAKLNSLMSRAAADSATYPRGGPGTLKAAIGELLGTTIHYFAAVDIDGMEEFVDALGGVDVMLDRAVNDPAMRDPHTGRRGFSLSAGMQHLDGPTAVAYARSRMGTGESDFTRAERQQRLLAAIGEKLTAGNLILTLPGLLTAIENNVTTDVPSSRLADLAVAAAEARLRDENRIVLRPPEFVTPEPNSSAGYILHPNLEAIRTLATQIFGEGGGGG